MSSAVGFLVVPLLAAVVGSVILWAVARARQPIAPSFQDRLRAIAPDPESLPTAQSPGIVCLDDPPEEH